MKWLSLIVVAILLPACATVPEPPHCEDTGVGLTPVNPTHLDPAYIKKIKETEG